MNRERARRRWRRSGPVCALWLYSCSHSGAEGVSAGAVPEEVSLPEIRVAAHAESVHHPIDATPSPDGSRVYYLASQRDERGEDHAGVFAVASDGGGAGTIDTVAVGEPLLSPVGIAISRDGQQLYVADAASGADATGGLFAIASGGGAIAAISGSEGYRPAGLTTAGRARDEQLFFTGRDPQTAEAGLFRISPAGGVPEVVAAGVPFEQPGGVALTAAGDAYVADVTEHNARVLRVRDGQVEPFVENIGLGYPAGVALSHDERKLLVSGVDPATKHDVVYFVELASGEVSRLTQVVGAHSEAAGLHRAHDRELYAWADSQADTTGAVYTVEP
ncbi:MAG: hypothetical protein ABW321_04375 [Polyangiales bacterium]